MKKIVLDLDNTTANYARHLHEVGTKMGTVTGKFTFPKTYGMVEEGWFSSSEDFFATHERLCEENHMARMRLLDTVNPDEIIRQWKARGYETVVVTARIMKNHSDVLNRKVAEQTTSWVREHIPSVSDIVIVDGDKTQVDADYYIDDSPNEITRIVNAGRKAIIRHQPYNAANVGHARISSLADVSRILD